MEKCPDCGAPDPVHDTHSVSYSYKDRHTRIPSVSGYHCAQCGGVTLDRAAVERYDDLVTAFHRRVDDELIDPAYIAAVRRKLKLDPREADDVLGTGCGDVARYEAGRAHPHPSTVRLLKLLDRHPELLGELHG